MKNRRYFFFLKWGALLALLATIPFFFFFLASRSFRGPELMEGPVGLGVLQETDGVKHLVPLEDVVSGGVSKDALPAINRPIFESVAFADAYLKDNGLGLVLEAEDHVRFYPFQLLVWHEVVNDVFEGVPLLVFYGPLTGSSAVYHRKMGGDEDGLEPMVFGTSGRVFNNDGLLFDRETESLWSPFVGEALVGERAGDSLVPYPSTVLSWQAFKSAYPKGEVLSRKTGADRDYTLDPYRGYEGNTDIFFPLDRMDARLPPKTVVYGYEDKKTGVSKAYPLDAIQAVGFLFDQVGETAVLILSDQKTGEVRGFSPFLGDRLFNFEKEGDGMKDQETGSLWNSRGQAVDGPLAGSVLVPVSLRRVYWFAWAAFFPDTVIAKEGPDHF
ncbi:MAG TPA: DUF3179 domain-containing protein [Patescibacteria group bacterium]|nr:DUF3179 domain-containing protein [Patescibacteria group bacterium]